jgi:TolA-binding protein
MDENKKKSSVWLYAVILFFSAFIVLVFAGYSQIRLNKSLENYKNQVFNTESERQMYQKHFASAQEMNEELNKEIENLKNDLENLRKYSSDLEDSIENLTVDKSKRETEAGKLSEAMTLFLEEKYTECVKNIKSIDTTYLSSESLKTLNILKSKAEVNAGKQLFDKGYELYLDGNYSEALSAFELSYIYAPDEEFSDKCLYYSSNAELKAGDRKKAVDKMQMLVDKYPKSKFLSKAKSFIKKYRD